MRIAALVYDFPHRKSYDFLTRLWLDGHDVVTVIASPFKPMRQQTQMWRVKPRRIPAPHPRDVAARMDIPYLVLEHSSAPTADALGEAMIDVAVIAGARILPAEVIDAPQIGILNFHPGLLPVVRGLDALRWSVYEGVAPGVTVHLIDRKVDSGRLVLQQELPVYDDDDWVDLSLRLDDTQLELITPSLAKLRGERDIAKYPFVGEGPLRSTMTAEFEERTLERFPSWRDRFSRSNG